MFKSRSFCVECRKQIAWFDNIPLLSFLMLGGKCRACKKQIAFQYWAVEFISALILLGLFVLFGLSPRLLWLSFFIYSLLIVTWVDFKHMEIPDQVTMTGTIFGLLMAPLFPELLGESTRLKGFLDSFLGLLVGGGIIWITSLIGDMILKKETMGGGDLKFLAMVGAFIGFKFTIMTFFVAPFFALPYALFQKYVKENELVPYGPFLGLAALFNIFYGEELLRLIF